MLALVLVATGLATAIWHSSIRGIAGVDILPRENLERRFHRLLSGASLRWDSEQFQFGFCIARDRSGFRCRRFRRARQ